MYPRGGCLEKSGISIRSDWKARFEEIVRRYEDFEDDGDDGGKYDWIPFGDPRDWGK